MYEVNELENILSRITSFCYYDNAMARLLMVCVLSCISFWGCGDDAKTDTFSSSDIYRIPDISPRTDMKISFCGDDNCDIEKGETMLNCFADCSVQLVDRHKDIKPNPGWIDPLQKK
jgi:hypothetical protein